MKDGKKLTENKKGKSKEKILKFTSDLPNINLDIQPEFHTSLSEELEEHLKKDKRRFFGGCGG